MDLGTKAEEECILLDDEMADMFEANFFQNVLDSEKEDQLPLLLTPKKREVSPEDVSSILSAMSLGVACWAQKLNVDMSDMVGPLVDTHEQTPFCVPKHEEFFKNCNENTSHLSVLGAIVQRNSSPCPFREMDGKVAWLLEAHPPSGRATRQMTATAVMHCLFTEVFGNSLFFQSGMNIVPRTLEIQIPTALPLRLRFSISRAPLNVQEGGDCFHTGNANSALAQIIWFNCVLWSMPFGQSVAFCMKTWCPTLQRD